jgi:uncharacterized protein (DUF1697 family)
MALVVFVRGINVGGHRRFRPSVFAKELHSFGVTSIGATGSFIVREPGSREKFRAALEKKLPFAAVIAMCDGRDVLKLVASDPFAGVPQRGDIVRFVSVLAKASRHRPKVPLNIPPAEGEWYVRVLQVHGRFVVGTYRRHMKTIGYLGQLDKVFGVPVTTRGWNTILAVARRLESRV